MAIEVISYNIKYGQKLERIADWVKAKNPMVFCLQEFPQESLGNFVPGYQEFFAASFNKNKQTYGEMIGLAGNIDLTSAFCVDLGRMSPVPFFPASGRRSALVIAFETQNGVVVIGDAHLEWRARAGYKLDQFKQLMGSIDQAFSDPEIPTILVGDFNFSNVFSGNGLERLALEKGYQLGNRFNTHRIFGIRHQVDYVFYKNCRVEEVRTERINFSDHDPVLFKVTQNGELRRHTYPGFELLHG